MLATYFELGGYLAAILLLRQILCCSGCAISGALLPLCALSLADALSSFFYSSICLAITLTLFGGYFTTIS
jgi:hypothetical protein